LARKKKRVPERPRWALYLNPSVHRARKRLPGRVRQRIGRAIDQLAWQPQPSTSEALRLLEEIQVEGSFPWDVRRLRVEDYRVVYAVSEKWQEIVVLTVERRPPYDYQDLVDLLKDLLSQASDS